MTKLPRSPAFRQATGLLLLGLPAVLGGCRGDFDPGDPSVSMEVGISPTPPTVGPNRLIVTLQDTAGTPLSDARVTVEGTMSHAGMVPVLDTAEAVAPGQYAVDDFRFTMAGDWILILEATLPDGRRARYRSTSHVVGAPPGLEADTGGGHKGMEPHGSDP